MPLSEHEQRQFEAIERALYADDPKFAAAVRRRDPAVSGRRRLYLAIGLVLLGIGALLAGVIVGLTVVGVAGFVVMLGGVVLAVAAVRTMTGHVSRPAPAPGVSVLTARRRARRTRPSGPHRSLTARLEDRWVRRFDRGDL